jgi:hypothetical protein
MIKLTVMLILDAAIHLDSKVVCGKNFFTKLSISMPIGRNPPSN